MKRRRGEKENKHFKVQGKKREARKRKTSID